MENISLTIILIAITCITSFLALNNRAVMQAAIFYPFDIQRRKDYYRFITSGFIHADFFHLLFNMYVLYSFGTILEKYYLPEFFGTSSRFIFTILYLGGLIVSDIPSFLKHRNDAGYRALGASGAVSAVVFACILIGPFNGSISLLFLPIGLPPVIFGGLYLLFTIIMAQQKRDNVNHDAHLYGALYGFIIPILFKPEIFNLFIEQIKQKL